jgi:alkylation response protein AidB-like acyl-CoA dehydrogenase
VTWHRVADALDVSRPCRTGLEQADLAVLRFAVGAGDVSDDDQAFGEWSVLVAAVTVGVAEGALRAAERYAAERSQFGAPIATFTGLRALLALMHERTASARALSLHAAAHAHGSADAAAALDAASRTAVDVCLDAVQVHGGYGYIDEYPIASRLRDAVSLRARARSREALATVAGSRLAVS